MKNLKQDISRRGLFQLGAAIAGTSLAGKAVAQMCAPQTAEQALGPFFPNPGTPEIPINESDYDLTKVKGLLGHAKGQKVNILGKIQDSVCKPISGATVIIWQASESGRYNHLRDEANKSFKHPVTGEIIQRTHDREFQYWGKATTDAEGNYKFRTIVPGFYPADVDSGWYRPPHIHFMVTATGYPQLVTQMYFRGSEIENNDFIQELNEKDFILQSDRLTEAQKRALVVDFKKDPMLKDELSGKFNIILER